MGSIMHIVDESARVQALTDYRVLDTPPSDGFDRLTALAAKVFGVPTALLTLVDARRQWFKSRVGMPLTETPREIAFCAVTIESDEVLVVPDAQLDPRFAENPLVTAEPHIRFYAGAPLRTASGFNVGSLAIIDYRSRDLDESQQQILVQMAALAVEELERWRRTQLEHIEALRSQSRRFSALVQNARDVIALLDVENRPTYVTPSVSRVLGYSPVEYVGHDLVQAVHGDDREALRRELQAIRVRPAESTELHLRLAHKEGGWRSVEVILQNLLGDADVRAIVVNARDVTARERAAEALRQSEARLRQVEKMEALGQLAGGIAHDFNNALSVILSNASFAMDQLPEDSTVRPELHAICVAVESASALIGRILAFGRRQPLLRAPTNLNDEAREAASVLKRLLPSELELVLDLAEPPPIAIADAAQLQQVILNLCINARDAMPHGGVLTLRTRLVELNEEQQRLRPEAPAGRWAVLDVVDTGGGIAPDLLEHIFEPFFTTKESGKGTGLGLASVYGTVSQHQGFVEVQSELGTGSVFSAYLPASG
jgi:two-component system, cell cycle sensor histidine kinase and response regulator CckA